MKHIIEYKQFENLASDFKEKADGLDTHDANNGYQAKKFCDLLTGNLKEEFMYRFTDGEMCLDLIEEFVDRVDLGDYDFHFRSLIASNKIKDMQQETGRGSLDLFHFIIDDLIVRSSRMGSDKTIAFLQDNFKDKFEIFFKTNLDFYSVIFIIYRNSCNIHSRGCAIYLVYLGDKTDNYSPGISGSGDFYYARDNL